MFASYDRYEESKNTEQWPGGEDSCSLGRALLILASPNGTKISCPIHGFHMIYGKKLWM